MYFFSIKSQRISAFDFAVGMVSVTITHHWVCSLKAVRENMSTISLVVFQSNFIYRKTQPMALACGLLPAHSYFKLSHSSRREEEIHVGKD